MRKIIITTFLIALIPLLVCILGKIYISYVSKKEISQLQKYMMHAEVKKYSKDILIDLPPPVRGYFEYTLTPGQQYIQKVYLAHKGVFKTSLDSKWIRIKGEQHFTTKEPGFVWIGKTALFTARDMYIDSKGSIIVSLLHLFQIVKGTGPHYDQGELLRWLGESVWFPTNLLPSDNLKWSAIDDKTARLSYIHEDFTISYKVHFDERGEITELETQRHMGEEGLTTWRGKVSNYQTVNGMKIPMSIEAMWVINSQEHSYAKFDINHIEHY